MLIPLQPTVREENSLSVLTPSQGTSSNILGISASAYPPRKEDWGRSREEMAVQRASSRKRR